MGFDQNSTQPLVNPHKWTSKINLGMVVGVLVFLVIGAIVIVVMSWKNPANEPSAADVPVSRDSSPP